MKLLVIKTGYCAWDVLKTLGLGILISEAFDTNVKIEDCGIAFELKVTIKSMPRVSCSIVEKVLALPELDEIIECKDECYKDIRFMNMDGLLAASFTRPGIRALSITNLLYRPFMDKKTRILWLRAGYRKAKNIASRLIRGIQKAAGPDSNNLVNAVCSDYLIGKSSITGFKKFLPLGSNLPVWSTLEPALGFSSRFPVSNHELISYNLTTSGPRFASFLAVIGAARILRAQRTRSQYVLYWLPTISKTIIAPGYSLPCLHFFRGSADRAILAHSLATVNIEGKNEQGGLLYHMFSVQGLSQSIAVEEREICLSHLRQISVNQIRYWINICNGELVFDVEPLSNI